MFLHLIPPLLSLPFLRVVIVNRLDYPDKVWTHAVENKCDRISFSVPGLVHTYSIRNYSVREISEVFKNAIANLAIFTLSHVERSRVYVVHVEIFKINQQIAYADFPMLIGNKVSTSDHRKATETPVGF